MNDIDQQADAWIISHQDHDDGPTPHAAFIAGHAAAMAVISLGTTGLIQQRKALRARVAELEAAPGRKPAEYARLAGLQESSRGVAAATIDPDRIIGDSITEVDPEC